MRSHNILKKYKLISSFETELNVEKEVFVNQFRQMTEKGYYSSVLGLLDIFSPIGKKYIGEVAENHFKIRERFGFDNLLQTNYSKVLSEFHTENDILKIKTTIQGMEFLPFILRSIVLIIYILMMLLLVIEVLIPTVLIDIEIDYVLPPFVVTIFVFFLVYFPYIMAKKSMLEMKNNIDLLYQLIEHSSKPSAPHH